VHMSIFLDIELVEDLAPNYLSKTAPSIFLDIELLEDLAPNYLASLFRLSMKNSLNTSVLVSKFINIRC
jgi:hypothetical protein